MNIVQIGCHGGSDHVQDFINHNLSDINLAILIDANPNIIPYCQTSYNHSKYNSIKIDILNYAIVKDSVKMPLLNLYVPKAEILSQHCSYSYAHMKEHHHKELDIIQVPTLTLSQLCDMYNINTIDYLYIDTEGLDIDILSSFNLKKYNVQNINFEYIHTDGPFSESGPKCDAYEKILIKLGYSCHKDRPNFIAKRNIPSGV